MQYGVRAANYPLTPEDLDEGHPSATVYSAPSVESARGDVVGRTAGMFFREGGCGGYGISVQAAPFAQRSAICRAWVSRCAVPTSPMGPLSWSRMANGQFRPSRGRTARRLGSEGRPIARQGKQGWHRGSDDPCRGTAAPLGRRHLGRIVATDNKAEAWRSVSIWTRGSG